MRPARVDPRREPPGEWTYNKFHCVTDLPLCRSTQHTRTYGERIWRLLAQVLERHLDPIIVELLEIGAELLSAARTAVEKLTHDSNGCVRLTLENGRASYVDCTI